jgi:tetratricopeptide (TPR) repeat protein
MMRTGFSRAGVAVAAAVALMVWRPALANDIEDAKRHFAVGKKAYEIGAYDEAIKEYGEAYRLIDDPALLFNLGQAHRLAGHVVEALRAYRMFLLKVPDSPNRSDVEALIADLQNHLPPPTMAPAPAMGAPVPHEPAPTAEPPAQTAPSPTPVDLSASRARRQKLIAGGIVAGAGVALIAGGIACGVLAQNAGNTITHGAQSGQAFDYNTYQSGRTDQTLEIALLAVGGAAVVAGATVMILGKRQTSRAHASIRPLVLGHTAGFAVGGAF